MGECGTGGEAVRDKWKQSTTFPFIKQGAHASDVPHQRGRRGFLSASGRPVSSPLAPRRERDGSKEESGE